MPDHQDFTVEMQVLGGENKLYLVLQKIKETQTKISDHKIIYPNMAMHIIPDISLIYGGLTSSEKNFNGMTKIRIYLERISKQVTVWNSVIGKIYMVRVLFEIQNNFLIA